MLTRMKLVNFKSWRELDIELAPITILFGTNSSGKSSVLQAILLIKQSLLKANGNEINFGGGLSDEVNLGSFYDVVFNHQLTNSIKIEFHWQHRMLKENVEIKYVDDRVEFEGNPPALSEVIFDIIHDSDGDGLNYIAPLRQYPQRTYLWSGVEPKRIEPSGENTIAALVASERYEGDLLSQVSEWLSKLGIVDELQVEPLDPQKRFYETRVKIGNAVSSLLDVGFGVSQVLPVITMLFFAPEGSIVLLEQPELHLHPNAQAVLADLFLHVAETRKLQLIVESHSEHLLRRLQRRVAESEYPFATPDNIKSYFCTMGKNGSEIQKVEIDKYGQIRNWPENFFGDISGDLDAMMTAAIAKRRKELSTGD